MQFFLDLYIRHRNSEGGEFGPSNRQSHTDLVSNHMDLKSRMALVTISMNNFTFMLQRMSCGLRNL